MSSKRDKTKSGKLSEDTEDRTGTEGGTGGAGSGIEFHEFIGRTADRDENMPPDELRRLLSEHDYTQQARVAKQKNLRDQRKDLRSGKVTLDNFREGLSSGMSSQYPAHPALKDKAQFSGIDRQNNPVPSENNVQTNEENRDELQLKYQLSHQPKLAARREFNPKPQR